MNAQLKIFNGRILTPSGVISNGTILVTGKQITKISEANIELPGAVEIDAGGNYVSPGFIDLHIHGGGGSDFMDGTVDAFLKVAATHARYGTTGMLPTTVSCEKEELLNMLNVYELADKENHSGAQFLGLHLEGPYLSMKQRGAQDPRYLRNPDPEEYREICSRSSAIKRWSAAPELTGAFEFAQFLRSRGILVALAHTDAIYEDAAAAFENGFTLATHFYSCMNGVTRRNAYRYAGVIEFAYLTGGMDVEVIADGVHCPPPLLKLIYKIKGVPHTALITDAMRASGMPEGESILGSLHNGLKVIIEDGVAKLPDRSSFAGSVATADRLVRTMINMADIPLTDAVRMITETPARILGISERKGSLEPGKDADIVIFDDQIQVQTTLVNGKIIYNKA